MNLPVSEHLTDHWANEFWGIGHLMNCPFTKWIFSKLTQNLNSLGLFKGLNEIMYEKLLAQSLAHIKNSKVVIQVYHC